MTILNTPVSISARTIGVAASIFGISVFAAFLANGVSMGLTARFTLFIIGMSAILAIIIRSMRGRTANANLSTEIDRLKASDAHLRARMHYMMRDAIGDIVAKSDDLVATPDLAYDEQRRLLTSIRETSHEVERTLADVASSHRDSYDSVPHIHTSILLGEELIAIASTSPFSDRFEFDIERTRAWGDPAQVRQILRTLVNHTTLGEAERLTLQTAQRGSSATATVSGHGAILPPETLAALSEDGEYTNGYPGFKAMRLAQDLAQDLGGEISHVQAFGVSHVVLTLPTPRARPASKPVHVRSQSTVDTHDAAVNGSAAAAS
jgi:hypothetical protein